MNRTVTPAPRAARAGSFLLALLLCLLLSACGDSAPQGGEKAGEKAAANATAAGGNATSGQGAQGAQGAPGEPVTGDRIILGTIGEPSNLLPFIASDASSHEVSDQIFVAALRYDKDLNIEKWAAASYEVLENGTLLRFTLRDDIRWEDGKPLTADDVEFTYRLMVDPKTPTPYAEDYLAIQEFRKTGPLSFEVRYAKPFARSLITWMHGIMPKHLLEGQDLMNTSFSRKPVGAGPYRLKEWEAGTRLTLEASPGYFLGRPYIDEVVYRVIPDLSTMFLELKAQRLDMMNLSPQQYLHQTNGAEWDMAWRKFQYLSFGYSYLGYNLALPMFKDVKVRQALACAIDRKALVAGVLLGQGMPTVGPYKPGTWVYNDRIDDYPYDPAKARELLAQAGWADTNGDGLIDRDGAPFAFTILTNQGNDQRIKAATIIQSQLKAVGIDVKIRTVEWAAFIKEFVDKGRFDAVLLGWNILQDPDLYDVWHSSKAVPGGLNFVGYKNPEVDDLLERARSTFDQPERKKLYDRFQEILHRDQPYCFLYVPYSLPIVSARFQGLEPAPAGLTHNFTRWWTPREQQRYRMQQ